MVWPMRAQRSTGSLWSHRTLHPPANETAFVRHTCSLEEQMLLLALDDHRIAVAGMTGAEGRSRAKVTDRIDLESAPILPGNCPGGYGAYGIEVRVDFHIDSDWWLRFRKWRKQNESR